MQLLQMPSGILKAMVALLQEKCRASKELIKDLEMMANTDFFIGSSNSGVPAVVATLRSVLYSKSQVTLADVVYDDLGGKIRRYWGLGGFKNVTVDTVAAIQHSRRHLRSFVWNTFEERRSDNPLH